MHASEMNRLGTPECVEQNACTGVFEGHSKRQKRAGYAQVPCMTIDASYEETPEAVKELVQGHAAPNCRSLMRSLTYKIGDIYVWILMSR